MPSAARRLTERGRRTRDRILTAATELFGTRGFASTSVDDVLRASGAGKSQFYHYFGSKEELGRAVLRAQRWRLIPYGEPAVGQIDDWDRIAVWFDGILRAAAREVGGTVVASDVFVIDAGPTSASLRLEHQRTLRLRRRLLWRGLRHMKRRGALTDEADPKRLSAFAAAAVEGGLQFARVEGSVDALRQAIGETYTHLRSYAVDGYGGDDDPPSGR